MENQSEIDDVFREPAAGGFSRQPVPRVLIEQILDLARRTPSGVNSQPWNVLVLQDPARAALVGLADGAVLGLLDDAASQTAFWEQFKPDAGRRACPWASARKLRHMA